MICRFPYDESLFVAFGSFLDNEIIDILSLNFFPENWAVLVKI
jgi:hypothetical protein